ncbi:MAG TPA: SH3 domain-containing protein [Rhodanobacter sp.]
MKRLVLSALALSLALPLLAHAADGYVTGNVTMRAGPDPSYPLIDEIPAGTEVDVQGCTEGWEWCDVISYNNRGWVAGNYIQYDYDNQRVLLPSYGAEIGIPIVSFVIGDYWNHYYRDRPFYNQRERWYRRPIMRRPPPPPFRRPYAGAHGHDDGGHPPSGSHRGPGYPGYPQPPGHLGPVGPGHALRPVQDRQPTQQRDFHPANRPPMSGRPAGRFVPNGPEQILRPVQGNRPPPQQRGGNPGGRPGNRPQAPAHAQPGNARPRPPEKKNEHDNNGGH